MAEELDNIKIVRVTRALLDEYVEIHNKLLPVQYPQKWYDEFFAEDTRVALAAIDTSICVAPVENDGSVESAKRSQIIGFVSGRVDMYDATSFCSYICCSRNMVRCGYIMSLGCLKSHRRRGIGSHMLNTLMCILSDMGCNSFSLHCTVNNAAAIQLYERHGFQTTTFLKDYYHFHGRYHDAYHLLLEKSNHRTPMNFKSTKLEQVRLMPLLNDGEVTRYRKNS